MSYNYIGQSSPRTAKKKTMSRARRLSNPTVQQSAYEAGHQHGYKAGWIDGIADGTMNGAGAMEWHESDGSMHGAGAAKWYGSDGSMHGAGAAKWYGSDGSMHGAGAAKWYGSDGSMYGAGAIDAYAAGEMKDYANNYARGEPRPGRLCKVKDLGTEATWKGRTGEGTIICEEPLNTPGRWYTISGGGRHGKNSI